MRLIINWPQVATVSRDDKSILISVLMKYLHVFSIDGAHSEDIMKKKFTLEIIFTLTFLLTHTISVTFYIPDWVKTTAPTEMCCLGTEEFIGNSIPTSEHLRKYNPISPHVAFRRIESSPNLECAESSSTVAI
uniref:Uncharacterized protein n=1 Tax=Strigamia maritima TaxID=126957 RepID=T1JHK3_STRMM